MSKSSHTEKKGRPTQSRREAERAKGIRSGPVSPAPTTRKEARERKKALKNSMSKEERQKLRESKREQANADREAMMRGDEAFLLARDKGPVRRHVREIVDSQRRILNMFMPLALGILLLSFIPSQQVQLIGQIVFMALMIMMVIDGVVLGRSVSKSVKAKFGEDTKAGWSLGFYAFMRASQPRRFRTPRVSREIGDVVS